MPSAILLLKTIVFMFVCLFDDLERQSSGHSCDVAVVWQADGTEINEMT